MKDSRLVEDTEHCLFCGSPHAEEHHIYFGQRREATDKYKLTVPLCVEHHRTGKDSPHKNRIVDLALKCWAQTVFEKEIGDRSEFRQIFRKSYL